MIGRIYQHLDEKTFTPQYKALVRTHLEYASSAWAPYNAKYIDMIENVQRRATKQFSSILPSDISLETSFQDVSNHMPLDRIGQEWNEIFQAVDFAEADTNGCEEGSRWSEWINKHFPQDSGDEFESLTDTELQEFCVDGYVTDIECYSGSDSFLETGLKGTCNIEQGLVCRHSENRPHGCRDFRVRYYCQCGSEAKLRVERSRRFHCPQWSLEYNDHTPSITDKGDTEVRTTAELDAFCPSSLGKTIAAAQCKDRKGEPFHSTRDLPAYKAICDLTTGLICTPKSGNMCPDFSIQYCCTTIPTPAAVITTTTTPSVPTTLPPTTTTEPPSTTTTIVPTTTTPSVPSTLTPTTTTEPPSTTTTIVPTTTTPSVPSTLTPTTTTEPPSTTTTIVPTTTTPSVPSTLTPTTTTEPPSTTTTIVPTTTTPSVPTTLTPTTTTEPPSTTTTIVPTTTTPSVPSTLTPTTTTEPPSTTTTIVPTTSTPSVPSTLTPTTTTEPPSTTTTIVPTTTTPSVPSTLTPTTTTEPPSTTTTIVPTTTTPSVPTTLTPTTTTEPPSTTTTIVPTTTTPSVPSTLTPTTTTEPPSTTTTIVPTTTTPSVPTTLTPTTTTEPPSSTTTTIIPTTSTPYVPSTLTPTSPTEPTSSTTTTTIVPTTTTTKSSSSSSSSSLPSSSSAATAAQSSPASSSSSSTSSLPITTSLNSVGSQFVSSATSGDGIATGPLSQVKEILKEKYYSAFGTKFNIWIVLLCASIVLSLLHCLLTFYAFKKLSKIVKNRRAKQRHVHPMNVKW